MSVARRMDEDSSFGWGILCPFSLLSQPKWWIDHYLDIGNEGNDITFSNLGNGDYLGHQKIKCFRCESWCQSLITSGWKYVIVGHKNTNVHYSSGGMYWVSGKRSKL